VFSYPRFFLHCVALALAGLPGLGRAITTLCVHDSQELRTALSTATMSGDSPIVINLRQGTYNASDAGSAFFLQMSHSNQLIGISGGWSGDNGACTQHSNNPALTTLSGVAGGTLSVATHVGNEVNNSLYISDITITNPNGANAACLVGNINASGSLKLERSRLELCYTPNGPFAVDFKNMGGKLDVIDVAMRFAQADDGMRVYMPSGGTTNLSQLSITANVTLPGHHALNITNFGGTANLSNSVIWGSTDEDIVVVGSGVTNLARVHYDDLVGNPTSNTNHTTGDPGFVVAGDPHLRADSPLVNSGIASPVGGTGNYDADGTARLQGVKVDVGAYELSDAIFAAGFE
jgi:hypothetical protein